MKRRALGRGLEALIPEPRIKGEAYISLDVNAIVPNSYQPRAHMRQEALEELAASIRENGIVQPILVRPLGPKYQIIAGERRWLAAQRAGLRKIPAIVRDIPEDKVLELALVENLQREDLNPIEEALAYQRLIEKFGLKQEEIARRVGKDRSTVANSLRLLRLPDRVRKLIEEGKLSAAHAKLLLSLGSEADQVRAAEIVLAQGLSVRECERLVRGLLGQKPQGRGERMTPAPDPNILAAEEKLRQRLGTKVKIQRSGGGGTIQIEFYSDDDLARIYNIIVGVGP